MVHIKKVEIFGFKSFGFRNVAVEFRPGLAAIVGPNGSGKSNILDAIIFAMGENKASVMRAGRLKELMHTVEGERRSQKLARSSVHFDNTDRGIPLDSDTVEITRELDGQGDNTYYLNKKKSNRSHIMHLLDVANAGLGHLNAIQQGTVTAIARFTTEQKRGAIEDLVGLTSFDEKKLAAKKQLDEADRRLDIALAKMGETKNRIDELEAERNEKMRHELLGRELDRYRAMDAAAKLKGVSAERESKGAEMKGIREETAGLEKDLAETRSGMKKFEDAKAEMLKDAALHEAEENRIKQELSMTLSEYEMDSANITIADRRIKELGARIPDIRKDLESAGAEGREIESSIGAAKKLADDAARRRDGVNEEARLINEAQKRVLDEQSDAAKTKSEIDSKLINLHEKLGDARMDLRGAQGKASRCNGLIASNSDKLSAVNEDAAKLAELKDGLESAMEQGRKAAAAERSKMGKMRARKTRIVGDLKELDVIRARSSRAANQFESKIKTVKGFMHEDYTVAKLMEDAGKLGIMGLAYQVVSWDAKYERAVLAVSSDWLKAIVVQDFATLVGIAEAARERGLPKLKIIPLDAIPDLRPTAPRIPGVTGILADHVRCAPEYDALRMFLFGNIVLAEDRGSARAASKAGYKAVTADGEYFEASGGTVVIDINSKISRLTKLISMSSDVDGLFRAIAEIEGYMERKRASFGSLDASIESHSERLTASEQSLAGIAENIANAKRRMGSAAELRDTLSGRIESLRADGASTESEIQAAASRIKSLEEQIAATDRDHASGRQDRIASELEEINTKKAGADTRHTEIAAEHRDRSAELAAAEAEKSRLDRGVASLREEEASSGREIKELREKIQTLRARVGPKEKKLEQLRGEEQELFSGSGYSAEALRDTDARLTDLLHKERGLTGQAGRLERRSDSLKRDLESLAESEAGLKKILGAFGFDAAGHDVSGLISGLESERDSLSSLNANAPARYAEVAHGYRSMSDRKNTLEGERNRIVAFIEDVEKEKKQTFLDAFDKVAKEIKIIFPKMTGGNAWLEIEDEDKIFESGVSYMVQFPHKTKRESQGVSGGEQTLAGTAFVLALQRLRPSPFYLFDELDASLDAPNAKRLADILAERSRDSQFLMVSHKENVVQKASTVYGVTSKNNSSSVVEYTDRRKFSAIVEDAGAVPRKPARAMQG